MNKTTPAHTRVSTGAPVHGLARRVRVLLIAALCVAPAALMPARPRAQQQQGRERSAKVTGVSTTRQGEETTVSISGDGPMNRVQTWQDKRGFHVVYPGGKGAVGRMSGGVTVERVGDSLELIIPTRPGASVTVQPGSGRLDLVVSGGLDDSQASPAEAATARARPERASEARERAPSDPQRARDAGRAAAGDEPFAARSGAQPPPAPAQSNHAEASAAASQPSSQSAAPAAAQPPLKPDAAVTPPNVEPNGADAQSATQAARLDDDASVSTTVLLSLLGFGGLGGLLFYMRRRRGREETDEADERPRRRKGIAGPSKRVEPLKESKTEALALLESFELPPFEPYKGDRRKLSVPVADDRRKLRAEEMGQRFSVGAGGSLKLESGSDKLERRANARPASAASALPTVLFGAYRIDQEIGKLVRGLPHSIEVLASRAADDRRAIETSLIKALNAAETGEDGQRRVRQALEDYGFVAHQSATLLLSNDSYERVSAARVLGQVQSRASLPFLLEALNDPEPVVRTEVVSTLGALGMPKAIGALIDLGRRYPEVPSSLLAPALTACSFEAQEWSWEMGADAPAASHASEQYFAGMGHQETVVDAELPEWLEDESLADALERLGSADVEARVAAALSLGQFPARRSVEALTAILVRDEVSAVRAAAVTSLGVIDHESVYAPVLFALADESREVRAAAARAYSSVNFDRADAAARLVETADHETLEDLAQACVKSGLAAQSVSRLSSDDRRQAYEAFSLLTLVVRGGQTDPILEAVASHSDPSVQMAAARLACLSDESRLLSMLRELAMRGGLPEDVCAVILEAVEEGARARG